MTLRTFFLLTPVLAMLAGCGGSQPVHPNLPDESADLGGSALDTAEQRASAVGTRPAGPELDGSTWQWIEAHCTEGPLDLANRGFAQQLRVRTLQDGFLLTYDQVFASAQCVQTVVQRAFRTDDRREMRMVEQARVSLPATDACEGRMEEERPGEVRYAGDFLEVLVQRSQWCSGFEVRMVYGPTPTRPLEPDQVGRQYIADFNRRDVDAIAAMFAETGSLLEPFTVSQTGGGTRHDGRDAIRTWYADLFAGVRWAALHLESWTAAEGDSRWTATWKYMDPRLDAPFDGTTTFMVAAGEIFEAEIRATPPSSALPSAASGPARR